MSGCDLPEDPETFKLWQDFQADRSKKRNKELQRFADFRGLYPRKQSGCPAPYEEVLAAYQAKYGMDCNSPN